MFFKKLIKISVLLIFYIYTTLTLSNYVKANDLIHFEVESQAVGLGSSGNFNMPRVNSNTLPTQNTLLNAGPITIEDLDGTTDPWDFTVYVTTIYDINSPSNILHDDTKKTLYIRLSDSSTPTTDEYNENPADPGDTNCITYNHSLVGPNFTQFNGTYNQIELVDKGDSAGSCPSPINSQITIRPDFMFDIPFDQANGTYQGNIYFTLIQK